MRTTLATGLLVLGLATLNVEAAPILPTSYSMPNGGGQASGGSFNYWDRAYTGAGATTTDGAALSGGLGDLTDGVIATDFWFNTENNAGTGPFVGWYGVVAAQRDPMVTFNFAGLPTIDRVVIHLDHSTAGGVFAPTNILIDGAAAGYVAPTTAGLYAIDLTGLNLTGASHTLQFVQAFGGNAWVFVSEVQFFGQQVVPEPAMSAMALLGIGLGITRLRRAGASRT